MTTELEIAVNIKGIIWENEALRQGLLVFVTNRELLK
jgi:hypothetical protein